MVQGNSCMNIAHPCLLLLIQASFTLLIILLGSYHIFSIWKVLGRSEMENAVYNNILHYTSLSCWRLEANQNWCCMTKWRDIIEWVRHYLSIPVASITGDISSYHLQWGGQGHTFCHTDRQMRGDYLDAFRRREKLVYTKLSIIQLVPCIHKSSISIQCLKQFLRPSNSLWSQWPDYAMQWSPGPAKVRFWCSLD